MPSKVKKRRQTLQQNYRNRITRVEAIGENNGALSSASDERRLNNGAHSSASDERRLNNGAHSSASDKRCVNNGAHSSASDKRRVNNGAHSSASDKRRVNNGAHSSASDERRLNDGTYSFTSNEKRLNNGAHSATSEERGLNNGAPSSVYDKQRLNNETVPNKYFNIAADSFSTETCEQNGLLRRSRRQLIKNRRFDDYIVGKRKKVSVGEPCYAPKVSKNMPIKFSDISSLEKAESIRNDFDTDLNLVFGETHVLGCQSKNLQVENMCSNKVVEVLQKVESPMSNGVCSGKKTKHIQKQEVSSLSLEKIKKKRNKNHWKEGVTLKSVSHIECISRQSKRQPIKTRALQDYVLSFSSSNEESTPKESVVSSTSFKITVRKFSANNRGRKRTKPIDDKQCKSAKSSKCVSSKLTHLSCRKAIDFGHQGRSNVYRSMSGSELLKMENVQFNEDVADIENEEVFEQQNIHQFANDETVTCITSDSPSHKIKKGKGRKPSVKALYFARKKKSDNKLYSIVKKTHIHENNKQSHQLHRSVRLKDMQSYYSKSKTKKLKEQKKNYRSDPSPKKLKERLQYRKRKSSQLEKKSFQLGTPTKLDTLNMNKVISTLHHYNNVTQCFENNQNSSPKQFGERNICDSTSELENVHEVQTDLHNVQTVPSIHETCKMNLSNKIPEIETYKNALEKKLGNEKIPNPLIEAENLIKWVLEARNQLTNALRYRISKMKGLVDPILTKCVVIGNLDKNNPIMPEEVIQVRLEERCKLLTGYNLHTHSTEPYFTEPTYIFPDIGELQKDVIAQLLAQLSRPPIPAITYHEHGNLETGKPNESTNRTVRLKTHPPLPWLMVDNDGKVHNIFPFLCNENPSKKWHCNRHICNIGRVREVGSRLQKIYEKMTKAKHYDCLKYIVTEFDLCPKKHTHDDKFLGHPSICHTTNYGTTDLSFLLNLRPHYPLIRTVLTSAYRIRKINLQLNEITTALKNTDVSILNKFAMQYKLKGTQFNLHSKIYNNEDELRKEYEKGIKVLQQEERKLPIHSCMSCECLKPDKDLRVVTRLKKPIETTPWKALNNYVNSCKNMPSTYVCKYCLGYFRKDKLPPICLLNDLVVSDIPKLISDLNQYERLLIQRAKAFQVVTKMGTVAGKNKPSSILNQKVVGRTFHLPLPVQQTLKKLPQPNQCLIPNQELYILVRGIPTNQRKMWESLVSVTKVYKALFWLHRRNPLYRDIQLPDAPADLLQQLSEQQTRVTYTMPDQEGDTQCSNSEDEDNPDSSTSCENSDHEDNPEPVQLVMESEPVIDVHGVNNNQLNVNQDSNIPTFSLPPGYVNPGNGCYANSVCQSLCSFKCVSQNLKFVPNEDTFKSLEEIRVIFEAFHNIVQRHVTSRNRLNDCTELRQALGGAFSTPDQQDAEHFYGTLINECAFLKTVTLIQTICTTTCSNSKCKSVMSNQTLIDYCFRLPLVCNFDDINQAIRYTLVKENQQCHKCENFTRNETNEVVNIPEIIVCQLFIYGSVYNDQLGEIPMSNNKIINLYDTNLVINHCSYTLQSVIYHSGAHLNTGHYTSAIRVDQNPWILTSDENVQVLSPSQHRGKPYLLFYKLQSTQTIDDLDHNLQVDSPVEQHMLINGVCNATTKPGIDAEICAEDCINDERTFLGEKEMVEINVSAKLINIEEPSPNLQYDDDVINEHTSTSNCANIATSLAPIVSTESGAVECQSAHVNENAENEREIQPHTNNGNSSAALLTQKHREDEFYQHYTVYQVNETRINKEATDLYQMLKVMADVIDNRDLELDVKCFPDLYPYGVNGLGEKRKIHVSAFEYGKLRMKSRHNRFRRNIQYIFFLLGLTNIRQLASGIYHKLSIGTEQVTAKDFMEKMKNRELDETLSNVFAKLRNTAQYWYAPRQDVMTMINNYGPATFFLTLSPSEYDWNDLGDYLRLMNPDQCKNKSISALIAMDPVSTSRFIDTKFHAILNWISGENGPLGTIVHYFWRREYQTRGLQHFHILLWTKDAPVLGQSSNAEVAEFIRKYVTCALPNKHSFPTIYNRVMKYQTHHHNSYCMRSKKYKGKHIKVCRFSFPRAVTETLTVRSVAQSIYGRRNLKPNSRLYDLPRTENETFINDYNAPILQQWQGNMDIQVICEKSTILSQYITKYQTKEEKSYNTDVFADMNSNKTLASSLWSIGMKCLNSRECGVLEAADTLLGLSLYGKDKGTVIRYVNVYMIRQRKLKKMKDMEDLNPDSTDIYCNNFVDTYYPDRPEVLENINLYQFAANYEVVSKETGTTLYKFKHGFLKKRSNPYLIKHTVFNVKTNPENYFYSLLLLFKPWRSVDDLKGDHRTYTEAFNECMEELDGALEYHEYLQDLRNGREHIEQCVQDLIKKDEGAQGAQTEAEIQYEMDEAAEAMDEYRNMVDQDDNVNLDDIIAGLNEEQKQLFDQVTDTIQKPPKKVRMFVSGVGGTGKSHCIKLFVKWVRIVLKKDVAVCAPTGIAAHNIGGLTVHRLLQLQVEKKDCPEYKKLRDDILKLLRSSFKNTILLILDEVSMVSNVLLHFINMRLCEIFDTFDDIDGWFGGLHILFFGDLLQLMPVMRNPPYVKLSLKDVMKYLKASHATNLWADLFSFYELTINMRQKDDPTYAQLLNLVRLGITTKEHNDILLKQTLKFKSSTPEGILDEVCEKFSELPRDTVCVLPNKDQCKYINNTMLNRLKGDEIILLAHDDIPGRVKESTRCKKAVEKMYQDNNSDETAGLETMIKIKVGAKVMVRRNIDVTLGLVNGAVGFLKDIKRDIVGNITSLIIEIKSKDCELQKVMSKFQISPHLWITRTQFPIILAFGITIHKCQGISLDNCMADIGQQVFTCGQSYVALSRVRSLKGLTLINYNPCAVKASNQAIVEYNRLYKNSNIKKTLVDEDMKKKNTKRRIPDAIWYKTRGIQFAENNQNNETTAIVEKTMEKRLVLYSKSEAKSTYVTSLCQCLFNIQSIVNNIQVIKNNSKNDVDDTDVDDVYKHELLHVDEVEDEDLVNTMIELSAKHVLGASKLDTADLRKCLGEKYKDSGEQDIVDCLQDILKHCAFLRNSTHIDFLLTDKCLGKNCGKTTKLRDIHFYLPLHVQQQKSTMQNLWDFSKKWDAYNQAKSCVRICPQCKENCKTKLEITGSSQVLIINIAIWERMVDSTKVSITAVPNTILTVNNDRYQLTSAILVANSLASSKKESYVPLLRVDKKWYNVSDEINVVPWPRGSKNVKLLFYEKINQPKGNKRRKQ